MIFYKESTNPKPGFFGVCVCGGGGGGLGWGGGTGGMMNMRAAIFFYTQHIVTTSSTELYSFMKIILTAFKIDSTAA